MKRSLRASGGVRAAFLLALGIDLLLPSCPSGAATRAQDDQGTRPPNVVLILVDDLGWTDLSCQGSRYYETPGIDRLAREGVRFTDAYAACAVCSPTRAAVLTGRYPARVGVTDWIRARFQRGGGTPAEPPSEWVGGPERRLLCPPNPFWMELDEVTIAEALGAIGYASCHVGKWHLGDDPWYPGEQGFDRNRGGCDYGQPPSYFDPYRNRRLPRGIPTLEPRREGEYLTDREADEAVRFIREHRTKPFFLYLAHYAVHTPIQAKEDLVQRYEAKPRTNQKNAKYAAMVHSVDEAVGKVLGTLDATGLAERTLVIFTSDNGGLLGPTDNAPLRAGKGHPYEGGIRVPLIVRWPGTVPPGAVSRESVSSVDLFPTVLEASGAEAPTDRVIDGVSLFAHLRSGGKETLGRDALYWHFPHYRGRIAPYSIARAGRWKLLRHHEGPRFELYDLEDDLSEKKDLSRDRPYLVERLDAKLMAHLASAGAKVPRSNPAYEGESSGEAVAGADRSRPRVLILGDSISIGYTPFVREMLAGEAEVFRPMRDARHAENCQGTTYGVENIDRWLEAHGGAWDVIHANFGLHDMKRVHPETGRNSRDPAHPRQASAERYERQLREIVERLERSGARLILATTTPVPPGGVRPHRDVEDPARYNEILLRVARERGLGLNDLYTYAGERLEEIQRPVNVHFTPEGSRELAARVAERIRRALVTRER